jgi:endonuclease/exonuclease/phosphatase family metal-dependent hydrolase
MRYRRAMSRRGRIAWLAMVLLAAAAAAAEPQPLRLMTYNIRLDLASDGVNAWPHRRQWVSAQIHWLRPDLFGLQEVLPGQRADLATDLPQYRIFGEGRDGNGAGEAAPIGYDTQRFEFLDGGTFWLSPTPDLPSKGWDAAYRRVVTWTRLRLRDSRQVVLAINTHWDHIGLEARRQSAAQMLRWIRENSRRCERVLVFGDFNSTLDSEQMRALVQPPLALRDARGSTRTPPFGPAGTFNNFGPAPTLPLAIDHILVGEGVEVQHYAVISQLIEGRVPSDHFPVLVDLAIQRCR